MFAVLIIAGILLLFNFRSFDDTDQTHRKIPKIFSFLIGGSIGFISGIVGIGGGIFLSPILLLLIRAGKAKHIATAASLFILINSIAGIFGQFTKHTIFYEIQSYWLLFLSVLIGGQIGNFLNIKFFPARILALVTSALVIFRLNKNGIEVIYLVYI